MEFRFNVTGPERKRLAGAISELLNEPLRYKKAPSFAFEVGSYHIAKDGTVTGEYSLSLMVGLEARGFTYEPSQTFHLITPRGTLLIQERFDTAAKAEAAGYGMYFSHEGRDVYIRPSGEGEHCQHFAVVGAPFEPEAPEDEPELLAIGLPLEDFTPEAIDNICKMVLAKEALLKKALGVDALPVKVSGDQITFPWFKPDIDGEHIDAYAQLIAALCRTAKEKKRVSAKAPKAFDNERFSMRVWLISLGMVGESYKQARKLLMAPLSGNAAWRYGKPEKKES